MFFVSFDISAKHKVEACKRPSATGEGSLNCAAYTQGVIRRYASRFIWPMTPMTLHLPGVISWRSNPKVKAHNEHWYRPSRCGAVNECCSIARTLTTIAIRLVVRKLTWNRFKRTLNFVRSLISLVRLHICIWFPNC